MALTPACARIAASFAGEAKCSRKTAAGTFAANGTWPKAKASGARTSTTPMRETPYMRIVRPPQVPTHAVSRSRCGALQVHTGRPRSSRTHSSAEPT